MKDGYSVAALAGHIGVAVSTVKLWVNEHPEFSDAVKIGQASAVLWWEARARDIALGNEDAGNPTITIFGLKNRASEEWRDMTENLTIIRDDRADELGDDELARIAAGGRKRTTEKATGEKESRRVH